jgi:hypothetical protein
MERFFSSLRPLIRFVAKRPGVVVSLALLFTVFGVSNAVKLGINPDFAELLPADYVSVQAIERLRENVGAASEAAVAIVSPSAEANRAYAEALLPAAMAQSSRVTGEPLFTRAEYRKDVDFIKDNALYLASEAELSEVEDYLHEEQEAAVLEENPFFFELDDEEDETAEGDDRRESLRALYDQLVESEYPVSDDSTTLVLRFYPAGAQTNIGFIADLYDTLDSLTTALQPAGYHPEMQIVLAGRLQRSLVEIRAITDDLFSSFGAGVLTVLLIVVGYFFYKSAQTQRGEPWTLARILAGVARLPALALVISLPLLMSLSWTFGVAYAVYAELNLMTTTLGLVLFGLGIDFGIHIYGRYTEERRDGYDVADSIETTFLSTGQAVATGAFTTAVAFYSLVIADFKGFSEFGFIAGTGVLLALVSMLLVLPAVLVLFEKYGLLNTQSTGAAPQPRPPARRFRAASYVVVASLALVVLSLFYIPPYFEYDFGKLEPEYTEYNERRRVISRVYASDVRRNPAYVITDTPEEIPAVSEALRRSMADSSTTIAEIESLQERIPDSPEAQQVKIDRIAAIRQLLDDPALAADTSGDITMLRRAAQTRQPISADQIPEFLTDSFKSKTGEIGNFVIIYPRYGLSDGRNSIAFADEVGTFTTESGRTYHAGSTSIVAADMLRLMREESPWMVLIAFTVVVLMMLLNFGSVRWAVLATVPLVVGVMWMLLLMGLFDMKLTFYNLVVLPAVLGIGNDAGVHIVHRYRERGRGSVVDVLRSTGEQIVACSMTTMVGFAGPLLSFHPGLRSIGGLAVIGIGATLVASILFLPALLQYLENRS